MERKYIVSAIIIIIAILSFNTKSNAVTAPWLEITSKNYSQGDKITDTNIKELDEGNILQLYAIVVMGNDLHNQSGEDNTGIYVQENNLNNVSWSSSNSDIATVDTDGKVIGISEGKVTITAKYGTYEDANYEITVKAINKGNIEIVEKRSVPQKPMIINAEYKFNVDSYNIPKNEIKNITASIENKDIAEIVSIDPDINSGTATINVKFKKIGNTKLIVSLNYDGNEYKAECEFSVVKNKYTLNLSAKNLSALPDTINIGDKLQLVAMFEIFGGSVDSEDVTSNGVVWKSSNEKVATIDEKGLITGLAEGKTTISAQFASCDKVEYNLIVKNSQTNKRKITYSFYLNSKDGTELPESIKVGDKIQLVARFGTSEYNSNGTALTTSSKDVSSNGTIWTSSDEKIAKVDEKGMVTGIAKGTATINAKYIIDGKTYASDFKINILEADKKTEEKKSQDDNTTAKEKLPFTGKKDRLIALLILNLAFAIKGYVKYRRI